MASFEEQSPSLKKENCKWYEWIKDDKEAITNAFIDKQLAITKEEHERLMEEYREKVKEAIKNTNWELGGTIETATFAERLEKELGL